MKKKKKFKNYLYRSQTINLYKKTKIKETIEYLNKEVSMLKRLKDYIKKKYLN